MKLDHHGDEGKTRLSVEDLVVNWHVTEACNYRCKYCYAAWAKSDVGTELHKNPAAIISLLDGLIAFFNPDNLTNPLAQSMGWQNVRLSIAGGEPTLLKSRLDFVITEAKQRGFKMSLISNGSPLDSQRVMAIAPHLSCLGISIDSSNAVTNQIIGRTSANGYSRTLREMVDMVRAARLLNPSISIKINTVVNAANALEDMSGMIAEIKPDRWKVLRALPIVSDALSVTGDEFNGFVARHAAFSSVMAVEDNSEMVESYIMIDPHGRFFQNSEGQSAYRYSSPIHVAGPAAAFAQIGFSPQKFAHRYREARDGERAA